MRIEQQKKQMFHDYIFFKSIKQSSTIYIIKTIPTNWYFTEKYDQD